MQLFVLTSHCTSRLHCKVCRDAIGGRSWRQSLIKNFELPDGKIDFKCPYGLPWNFVTRKTEDKSFDTNNSEVKSNSKVSSGTRGGCGCGRK